MATPLVSICIPTYNGAEFIEQAVRSAIAQTIDQAALEMVVSDSGSTDGTVEKIQALAAEVPFPLRVIDERTPGMVRNWNAVVRGARGTFIKFLFQDDLLDADCVEKLVLAAMQDSRVGFAFCRRRLIVDPESENSTVASYLRRHLNLHASLGRLGSIEPGNRLIASRALLRHPINKIGEPTVVLVRRSLLLAAGGFNERMNQLVDFEMWLRLLTRCHVAVVDEVLAAFRVHGAQMSAKNGQSANSTDTDEFFKTLGSPDIYPLLHPAARLAVRRERTVEQHLRFIDRGYSMADVIVQASRRIARPFHH